MTRPSVSASNRRRAGANHPNWWRGEEVGYQENEMSYEQAVATAFLNVLKKGLRVKTPVTRAQAAQIYAIRRLRVRAGLKP